MDSRIFTIMFESKLEEIIYDYWITDRRKRERERRDREREREINMGIKTENKELQRRKIIYLKRQFDLNLIKFK